MANKETIKSWFRNGAKPTEKQFWAWMDSFFHKEDKIPMESVEGMSKALEGKADASALEAFAFRSNTYTKDEVGELVRTKVDFPMNPPSPDVLGFERRRFLVGYEEELNTVPGQNEPHYNAVRFSLESIGENLGNSNLKVPQGQIRELDVTGAKFLVKGKESANNDASFNRRPVENANGEQRYQDADLQIKADIIKMPSLLSEQEKTVWKTQMNGGWTTNSMSVVLINPIVLKNKNEMQFVTVLGTNLNFNPSNFKVEIITDDSTANNVQVVTIIKNSHVQLINSQSLGFWINTAELNLQNGDYKLRLTNGVASYITPMSFKVIDAAQVQPLNFTHSQNVVLQSGTSTLQKINSSTDVVLSPDENIKPLADVNYKDIVAQFQTDNILRGNQNWSFKVVINNDNTPNNGIVESYFGLSSTNSKGSILNTLDFELSCGKSGWSGYLYTQGFGKMIREVNSTVIFTKYQNNLSIIVLGLSGTNVFISTHIINTDNDYRFVFGRNNGGTKRSSSFFITEAYKF